MTTLRAGVTLVELIAVIAILGLVAVVAAPALRTPELPPSTRDIARELQRRSAHEGRPMTAVVQTRDGARWMTAWPNGVLVADTVPRAASVAATGGPNAP
jgi:prepilin-type N-terminal cleavage/methylation domain-containing protein